jgi:hypothetical protein
MIGMSFPGIIFHIALFLDQFRDTAVKVGMLPVRKSF